MNSTLYKFTKLSTPRWNYN